MKKNNTLIIIAAINIFIFSLTNLIFDIKYEQVDDFIIYNLYSGLDGTYNVHGVYIHPVICFVIGILFKIISTVNWHSIFLLTMQFICFTVIGYIILKKHKTPIAILLYTIFASIFYTSMLLLIQYTSVAALLILTSFFIIIYCMENESKKWLIALLLYTIGIMIRMQSLLIIIPFMAIYLMYYFIKYKLQGKTVKLIKKYIILLLITVIVYGSNILAYSSDLYKEYIEFNNLRAHLQDLSYTSYEECKEIFKKIGWSKNDHYLFYTVNIGDENVYNKENLQEIVNYKKQNNNYYNLNLNIYDIFDKFQNQVINTYTIITILFATTVIISMTTKRNRILNIVISITTISIHILFIILNRSMLRVVIPEYILGTALIIYNLCIEIKEINMKKLALEIILTTIVLTNISGAKYNYGYNLNSFSNYKELIQYTNENKENVYLYTVPSLQYRYYAYSVYEMPPKSAFSNLKVMGGWDMYTENYYEFKQRYDLDGTFLDLLKENVYLIDGDVRWSGVRYSNYIDNIVLFIKEHYNIDVKYEKVKSFNNLYIYKLERNQ